MWREVGIQLNLDITVLNEIRANHHGDVRQCCTRMFEVWLEQDTEASWITVMSACGKESSDEPHPKDHVDALNQLCTTSSVFLESLFFMNQYILYFRLLFIVSMHMYV